MPNFWLGPLLIMAFSIELGWFPVSGAESPGSIVLPAITLGLGMSAILTRITRSSVLDTIKEDYVRTAYAKGLPPRTVLIKHALRTALIPVVTIIGLQFGALLAGSIITEEIFGWPGLGRAIIHAISERDFPMIQGCVLLIAVTYVAVNTVTDLIYTLINPRVRLD
jgi:peptide/nickel transport system permease protein